MRGINDLETVFDTTEFLGMTFYFGSPWSFPAGDSRAAWYGFDATPSVMFGGDDPVIGGGGTMYYAYEPIVLSQLASASPLVMASSFVLDGEDINLSVQIDVDLAVSGSNNQVLFFVCQEGLHQQTNMVVDILPGEPFNLTTPGQSVTVDRSFTMDPSWNDIDLRIIVVVQNMTTREILQATLAEADYAAQLVVDAEPDGAEATWHLTGPGLDITKSGDLSINLWSTGSYTITWDDIPYWTSPTNSPETLVVAEDGLITFLGQYTNPPFISSTAGDVGNTGSGQAVSLVDFDNDGDLDVHVANDGSADQLLQNDGAGSFIDIATGDIAETGASKGAAWADINGDGNLDVFVTRYEEENFLMIGDGSGGFTTAGNFGLEGTGPSTSASWVDYDLDKQLDLYVVNNGDPNTLLKGFGDIGGGTYLFANQAGVVSDASHGNGACWTDGDLNGRPDLFIANQYQTNLYLQNDISMFIDLTNSAGIENTDKAMGAAFGDYDNDGDFDIYVANEGMPDLLYRSGLTFRFTKLNVENMNDNGYGRGAAWADFNNDTFLDVYVVRNGQTDMLLLGDGAGNFERVQLGPEEASGPGNAVACGDLDDDGDIDVFVSREGEANAIMYNSLGDGKRWIKLHLTGADFNTSAIGARVVLTADGVSQTRMVTAGSGYLCNNALDPHFGLGTSTTVDQIEIFWPDETYQVVGPTFSNQTLSIVQGQDLTSGAGDPVPALVTGLGQAHPNPFNPYTKIEFSLAKTEGARLDVFTIDGRLVRTLVDRGLSAGPHSATWDGTDRQGRTVASGTYFYRLTTASGFNQAGRMVLVK